MAVAWRRSVAARADPVAGARRRLGRRRSRGCSVATLTRAVDAQARWSKPLGDFNHRWLAALFHPIRPIQDFLNGTWLGHPVHAVVTDVPIGALTVSIVADLIGQPLVADVSMLLGVLAMVAAAVDRPRRLHRGRRHRPDPGDGPRGRSWSSPSSLYLRLAR